MTQKLPPEERARRILATAQRQRAERKSRRTIGEPTPFDASDGRPSTQPAKALEAKMDFSAENLPVRKLNIRRWKIPPPNPKASPHPNYCP